MKQNVYSFPVPLALPETEWHTQGTGIMGSLVSANRPNVRPVLSYPCSLNLSKCSPILNMPHAILSPNIPSARHGPPHSRILPLSLIRSNVRPSLNTLRSTFPPNIPSSARHGPPHSHILPHSLIRSNVRPSLNTLRSTFPPNIPSSARHDPPLFHLLPLSRPVQMFAPLTKKQTPGPCRTPVLSVISPLHRGSAAPPIPAASAGYS